MSESRAVREKGSYRVGSAAQRRAAAVMVVVSSASAALWILQHVTGWPLWQHLGLAALAVLMFPLGYAAAAATIAATRRADRSWRRRRVRHIQIMAEVAAATTTAAVAVWVLENVTGWPLFKHIGLAALTVAAIPAALGAAAATAKGWERLARSATRRPSPL